MGPELGPPPIKKTYCVVCVLWFIRRHNRAGRTAGAMTSAACVVAASLCTLDDINISARAEPIDHGLCMACCTPWSESLPRGDMCTQCLSMVHKECMASSCTVYGRKDGILRGQCRRCMQSLPMVTVGEAANSCSVCLVVHGDTADGRVRPCTLCADVASSSSCGGKSCDTCSAVIADGNMASWKAEDRVSFACAVRNNLHGPESVVLRPSCARVRESNRSSSRCLT